MQGIAPVLRIFLHDKIFVAIGSWWSKENALLWLPLRGDAGMQQGGHRCEAHTSEKCHVTSKFAFQT